jgi:hypothetical protein
MFVNGEPVLPTLPQFETVTPSGSPQIDPAHKEQADRATPLVALGSSVLAPGLEAAIEF